MTESTTMHDRLAKALIESHITDFLHTANELADALLATSSIQGVETLEARAAKYSDDNTRLAQLLNKMEDERDGAVEDSRIYWRQAKVAREHADVLGEALDKVNALIRVLSLMTSAEADDALATIKAARDAHQAFKEAR